MKPLLPLLPLLLIPLLLLTGCKSSSVVSSKESPLSSAAYVKGLSTKTVPSQVITAKTDVELTLGDKQVSVNGNLKMKRNELIQLSFTFLGFEVGRIEFTPTEVLLVDRANKRYVRGNYAEVDALKEANLNFTTLQALFWNELFIPGTTDVAAHYADFNVKREGGETIFTLTETPLVNYEFRTETNLNQLTRTTILPKKSDGGAFCAYNNFTTIDNTQFPQLISFGLTGRNNLGMTLSLFGFSSPQAVHLTTDTPSFLQVAAISTVGSVSHICRHPSASPSSSPLPQRSEEHTSELQSR